MRDCLDGVRSVVPICGLLLRRPGSKYLGTIELDKDVARLEDEFLSIGCLKSIKVSGTLQERLEKAGEELRRMFLDDKSSRYNEEIEFFEVSGNRQREKSRYYVLFFEGRVA